MKEIEKTTTSGKKYQAQWKEKSSKVKESGTKATNSFQILVDDSPKNQLLDGEGMESDLQQTNVADNDCTATGMASPTDTCSPMAVDKSGMQRNLIFEINSNTQAAGFSTTQEEKLI